jgi:hypothetical protein
VGVLAEKPWITVTRDDDGYCLTCQQCLWKAGPYAHGPSLLCAYLEHAC